MALKLMYITNKPEVAAIAEKAGVDRIFVDMEYIGKADRQGGMNTVQSHHTVTDVRRIRQVISKAELLVRVNPIHDSSDSYSSSEEEIAAVIDAGADIVMLPFFKSTAEVQRFLRIVANKAKTMLLVETPEAVECLDEILALDGIDYIHIGINDLSLGYGKKFMFELLADGTVESICNKCREAGIPYGFGGIAGLGKGTLPAEMVIQEHYRLGSSAAILSRSFCNCDEMEDIQAIKNVFDMGLKDIRSFERECSLKEARFFEKNRIRVCDIVNTIVGSQE